MAFIVSRNSDVSADIYCQNINNRKHEQSSYLYETEKRVREQDAGETERERVCVREREDSHKLR